MNLQTSSGLENLDESFLLKVFPAVNLEVTVDLADLRLQRVLVGGDGELLGVVRVAVGGVENKQDLGQLAAIISLKLEVVDGPSGND